MLNKKIISMAEIPHKKKMRNGYYTTFFYVGKLALEELTLTFQTDRPPRKDIHILIEVGRQKAGITFEPLLLENQPKIKITLSSSKIISQVFDYSDKNLVPLFQGKLSDDFSTNVLFSSFVNGFSVKLKMESERFTKLEIRNTSTAKTYVALDEEGRALKELNPSEQNTIANRNCTLLKKIRTLLEESPTQKSIDIFVSKHDASILQFKDAPTDNILKDSGFIQYTISTFKKKRKYYLALENNPADAIAEFLNQNIKEVNEVIP